MLPKPPDAPAPLRRTTRALRVCAWCGARSGVASWPWTGRASVVTHGLCARCGDALAQARAAADPQRASLPAAHGG